MKMAFIFGTKAFEFGTNGKSKKGAVKMIERYETIHEDKMDLRQISSFNKFKCGGSS
jgi:hypothetical protein